MHEKETWHSSQPPNLYSPGRNVQEEAVLLLVASQHCCGTFGPAAGEKKAGNGRVNVTKRAYLKIKNQLDDCLGALRLCLECWRKRVEESCPS